MRLLIKEINDCQSCPMRLALPPNEHVCKELPLEQRPPNQYACKELPPEQRKTWYDWWNDNGSINGFNRTGHIYYDCPLPKITANPGE